MPPSFSPNNIVYPAALDNTSSIPLAVDKSTPLNAAVINTLRAAIIAIEDELGIKPSGLYSTVKARLNFYDTLFNVNGDPTNSSLLGPSQDGYVLTWDGYSWSGQFNSAILSGTASGDLSGSYPNPTVIKIQTIPVSSTPPTSNQVLAFNGTNWIPTTLSISSSPTGAAGGDLSGTYPNPTIGSIDGYVVPNPGSNIGLFLSNGSSLTFGNITGDITTSGYVSTLATVNSSIGTFGSSTSVPVFTVNAKGLITAANNTAIAPPSITGITGDAVFTGTTATGTITLDTVNSNTGFFGSATQVGTFTVNSKGLITAASNTTISGVVPGGSAGGDLSGTYPNPSVVSLRGSEYTINALSVVGTAGTQSNSFVWQAVSIRTTGNSPTTVYSQNVDSNKSLSIQAQWIAKDTNDGYAAGSGLYVVSAYNNSGMLSYSGFCCFCRNIRIYIWWIYNNNKRHGNYRTIASYIKFK